MTTLAAVALRRLASQHLERPRLREPRDVVAALGAVQSQDYAGAKWAIGQRAKGLTDDSVERAFNDGQILRTHVMRPTWHFVVPSDIRWMLQLTAPRVHATSAHRYRELALDDAVFRRSHAVISKALQGGKQVTRNDLGQVLDRARIETRTPQRLVYLLMRAELDGIICSGARKGKNFTYALLEERVPPATVLERDEALRELVMRYFTTRGPATPQDFSWWSGLTVADAKRGLQAAGSDLEQETVCGQVYWSGGSAALARVASPTAHLLPNYDEYFIGFRDRSAILQTVEKSEMYERGDALSAHIFVIDGQVSGGWRRTLRTKSVSIDLNPVVRLTTSQRKAVELAAERYGAFLELPVEIGWGKSAR